MTAQGLRDPNRTPSRDGVLRAANKISELLPPTPLLPLDVDGRVIWCKAEMLQPIGAFKIRGAWHRLSDLSEDERARGIVAFSSGNHAQGIAWAARKLGIDATILMPDDAPKAKIENSRAMGATVITHDRKNNSREELAAELAAKRGSTIVPSFDDPWIVEGQGSVGVEAAGQLKARTGQEFDQAIICVGGGGLASGCSLALPNAEIIGVEPEGWDDMAHSLAAGKIIPVGDNPPATLCDALQTKYVSNITLGILSARNAKIVTVTDEEVKAAMRLAFKKLRVVVEPGGAVALAAILAGKVKLGNVPFVTLSGGNVDPEKFARIIST